MQQPSQVAIWIQPVFLGRFNQAINDSAGLRAFGYIGEQEIFPPHHEGFDAAFSPVVADFEPAITKVVEQIGPVLSRVLYCFA